MADCNWLTARTDTSLFVIKRNKKKSLYRDRLYLAPRSLWTNENPVSLLVAFCQSTLALVFFQLEHEFHLSLWYSPFEMKSYLFMASLGTETVGSLCSHFPGIYVHGVYPAGFRRGVKSFGFFHTEFTWVSFCSKDLNKSRINGFQWTPPDYKPQVKKTTEIRGISSRFSLRC